MKELKIISKEVLEDAADAIRTKSGSSDPIAPEDFDDAIDSIQVGITPTGTKSITANGTGIDVTNYASVDVAVPTTTPALTLGWTGDHWEGVGEWNQLPEDGPSPVNQQAVLSVDLEGQGYSTPAEGDAVIACGSHGNHVIVAGFVWSYENNLLTIQVAAMSSM